MYHWQNEKYVKGNQPKLNRITLCISSQVGCAMKCIFCVTGKLGFKKDLTREEIISQILFANAYVKKRFGKKGGWNQLCSQKCGIYGYGGATSQL